jgi:hypothetical protein
MQDPSRMAFFLLDQDLGQPKLEELAGSGRACLLVELGAFWANFSLLELRRARSSHSQLCGLWWLPQLIVGAEALGGDKDGALHPTHPSQPQSD